MAARMVTEDDLRWLVCPVCHQALRLTVSQAAVECTGCGRVYPIEDGLPVLLAGRASRVPPPGIG